ncbi:MAG: hypothetical protein K0S32_3510 [Bacteroidetes bacterium]|jgi:hypothetical protein|nr:hypothetical protein [Bacteroidota bacterium]
MPGITNIIYLFIISTVLVVASVYLLKGSAVISNKNTLARFSLWFFIFCNVVAEYIAYYLAYVPNVGNEFIYGFSIVIHTPALFIFYSLVTQKKLLHLACITGWTIILVAFFMERYWHPKTIIYVFHVAGYYTIMTIVSLLFLWYNLKNQKTRKNKFAVRLGILFSIYFSIAFTIIPVNFITDRFYFGEMFFYYASSFLNDIYYFALTIIVLLHMRQKDNYLPDVS